MINKEILEKDYIILNYSRYEMNKEDYIKEDYLQLGFKELKDYSWVFYKQIDNYTVITCKYWDGNAVSIYKNNEYIFSDYWTHNLDLEETLIPKMKEYIK